MNLGLNQSRELAQALCNSANLKGSSEVWIAPSFTSLPAVADVLARQDKIKLGAQNLHWESKGAFTGEISSSMLKEAGCSFVLTGHSERRQYFGDTSETVAKRTFAGLNAGLQVVFCIGETLGEREGSLTEAVLAEQLSPVFSTLTAEQAGQLVIAYEPVWAIGTGKVASLAEISETHSFIEAYCTKSGLPCPPILYGGSVTPDNFAEIIAIPNVSGALVGGASLLADKFSALVEIANR